MQLALALREQLQQQIVTARKVDLFVNTGHRGNEKDPEKEYFMAGAVDANILYIA